MNELKRTWPRPNRNNASVAPAKPAKPTAQPLHEWGPYSATKREKSHDFKPIEDCESVVLRHAHAAARDPDASNAVVHEGPLGAGPAARRRYGVFILADFRGSNTTTRHPPNSTARKHEPALSATRE